MSSDDFRSLLKGMVAGAIGGLAGTWAMSHAQNLWTRAVDEDAPESAAGKHDARDWQERHERQNANELAANVVARAVLGRPFTRDELRIAAPLVHYGFGAAVGAMYGATLERTDPHRAGSGLNLGTTIWMAADESAMPLLGLSGPTTERPAEMHAQAFAAHIVYGLVTEYVRRRTRTWLGVNAVEESARLAEGTA